MKISDVKVEAEWVEEAMATAAKAGARREGALLVAMPALDRSHTLCTCTGSCTSESRARDISRVGQEN